METEYLWKKCNNCGKSSLGPQRWLDSIEVCPYCDSPDLELITKEAAMDLFKKTELWKIEN